MDNYLPEKKLNIQIHEFCRTWFKTKRRLPSSTNQIEKNKNPEMRASTIKFDYKRFDMLIIP